MSKIINYETLEEPIISIEKVLNGFDMQEKSLILNVIRQRMADKLQKQKVQDTVGDHPLIKMANKFLKNKGGEEDG